MDKGSPINKSNFDILLDWLDEDRKSAAKEYESIRLRLTKIFYARGCHIAEELADETIERVSRKAPEMIGTYEGDPKLYFYAVGKNVFREWTRKPKTDELDTRFSIKEVDSDVAELRDRCLTKCMKTISTKQAEFIFAYYQRDKKYKIEQRKKMAIELGITKKALRVRAFRVRNILQKCVFECVENKNNEMF